MRSWVATLTQHPEALQRACTAVFKQRAAALHVDALPAVDAFWTLTPPSPANGHSQPIGASADKQALPASRPTAEGSAGAPTRQPAFPTRTRCTSCRQDSFSRRVVQHVANADCKDGGESRTDCPDWLLVLAPFCTPCRPVAGTARILWSRKSSAVAASAWSWLL